MSVVSDSRYRWVVLVIAWLSYMAVYMVRVALPPLFPFVVEELSLSKTEVGLLGYASQSS